jgi:hypothetical protein
MPHKREYAYEFHAARGRNSNSFSIPRIGRFLRTMLLSLVVAFCRQRCDLRRDLAVIAIDGSFANVHLQETLSAQSEILPRRHLILLHYSGLLELDH